MAASENRPKNPPAGIRPDSSRHSRQRQAILESLQAVTSHPTAVELHELVRRRLPKVSLGTVYRNLELLARRGLIAKLEYCGGEARYDANLKAHDHLRCLQCGRVDDLGSPPLAIGRPQDHDLYGYEVIGHRLEYLGICPRCRQGSSVTPRWPASGVAGGQSTTPGESEHA